MPAPLDLTGRVSGRLTVIRRVENSPKGNAQWLCVCRCGKQTVVGASRLNRELTKSCGCAWTDAWQIRNANKFVDLEGKRFGRYKVFEMVFKRHGTWYWRCVCKCGTEMIVNGHSLKQGLTKSCGCLQRERTSKARKRACCTQTRVAGRFARAA